ncbi:hypothetical protein FRC18_003118 [Serendipita sp. 400]|nr:hypothetical protein FRC18_003118 [Serendipita sp. 400]
MHRHECITIDAAAAAAVGPGLLLILPSRLYPTRHGVPHNPFRIDWDEVRPKVQEKNRDQGWVTQEMGHHFPSSVVAKKAPFLSLSLPLCEPINSPVITQSAMQCLTQPPLLPYFRHEDEETTVTGHDISHHHYQEKDHKLHATSSPFLLYLSLVGSANDYSRLDS